MRLLAANESEIVLAGGLRDAPAGWFVGGLWILEVPSRERAIELVERNPYFVHGVRRYRLHVWGKAFPDKQAVL
ncbi:MAG: YciI family protein [Burkholderiales bacterium]